MSSRTERIRPNPPATQRRGGIALLPGTLPVARQQLPQPATELIGRDHELVQLTSALLDDEIRLITLTGPGGVGKTRLAVTLASRVHDHFPDGVFFVPLAGIEDPHLVPAAVSQAFGLRDPGDRSPIDLLVASLQGRSVLLVLDSFERLLPAAEFVGQLVTLCPRLKCVVSSRSRLNLAAERAVPVMPLSLPSPRAGRVPAPDMDAEMPESVRLFASRARAVSPHFTVTNENADDVGEICRRLDGLPLAIELAAPWSRIMPPPALLARLEPRLTMLTGGPRDSPARLQTMRDAIGWSYDLLTPAQQARFRSLSVFAGGFTVEAAVEVAAVGADRSMALDALTELADRSLLVPSGFDENSASSHGPRFAMLDTIREFGLELLTSTGEVAAVRRRHASWCIALAELAEPNLMGSSQRLWLDRLEAEIDNLRATLGWLLDDGNFQEALRLVGALEMFWIKQTHFAEGRTWLERALEGSESGRPLVTREALTTKAKALVACGSVAFLQGDFEAGAARHQAGVEASRAAGDPAQEAHALTGLGGHLVISGRPAEGAPILEAALSLYDQHGDAPRRGMALAQLALAVFQQGDAARARSLCETAVSTLRSNGEWWGACFALTLLGAICLGSGDTERAGAAYTECVALAWENGETRMIAEPLTGLGAVAALTGHPVRAGELLGAAEALAESIGLTPLPHTQAMFDRASTVARQAIGRAAFAAASAEGKARPIAEIVAEVLEGVDDDSPLAFHLTPRERAVLRLLTQEKTDKEIGATLFISHRTAMWHVANLLSKLGVASRAEAAEYAARHDIH